MTVPQTVSRTFVDLVEVMVRGDLQLTSALQVTCCGRKVGVRRGCTSLIQGPGPVKRCPLVIALLAFVVLHMASAGGSILVQVIQMVDIGPLH